MFDIKVAMVWQPYHDIIPHCDTGTGLKPRGCIDMNKVLRSRQMQDPRRKISPTKNPGRG